jgi:hypothetical protein
MESIAKSICDLMYIGLLYVNMTENRNCPIRETVRKKQPKGIVAHSSG